MEDRNTSTGDICLLMVPTATYKALSDAASKHNLTVAQLFQRALDEYLKSLETRSSSTQLPHQK